MNIDPVIYLIGCAPIEPQSWFDPVMPEARPPVPTDVPEKLLMAHWWHHYEITGNERTFSESHPDFAWAKENGPAYKKAAQWDAERDRQRVIQWPAAWAKEQLRQINVQFVPGAPGMVPMYVQHDDTCGYTKKES